MTDKAIRNIVILGGGTSGWMTAAALLHHLEKKGYSITLVESESIGTVGVGEATLPHLRFFNQTLGIDEKEFMLATNATYKMGIEFSHWGKKGDAYIHPFGDYGQKINNIDFHHFWVKQQKSGDTTPIDVYSLPVIAASREKFTYPSNDPRSVLSSFSYAYHLDASLYAKYLRAYSEQRGVQRCEGKVTRVIQDEKGFISALELDQGRTIKGDFFIDCSGFRGVLIEQTLNTGYDDWSHWLPCDRAVAVPCELNGAPLPYTKAIARDAGWQWRIPLQHRTGNGQVYCSQYLSDDEACASLLQNLDGQPIAEPNFLRFTAGKRKQAWNKNCVAIGLAGGFLEPLESTSIYLVQIAIMKLMEFLPDKNFDAVLVNEFNRLMDMEYLRVRDFLVLHYHATTRSDSPFWDYCRTMKIPDELEYKMNLFKARGHVVEYQGGLFLVPSWIAVYLGQGIIPNAFDLRVNRYSDEKIKMTLADMRNMIDRATQAMPNHALFLQQQLLGAATSGEQAKATMSLYGAGR
jgi:tryptophan 7-halogenase